MKTKIVPAKDLDPLRGLRAGDYIPEIGVFDKEAYLKIAFKSEAGSPQHDRIIRHALRDVVARCYGTAVDKGWWEKYDKAPSKWLPEVISSKICLMHSELSEALEELRNRKDMGLKPYFSAPKLDGLGGVIHGASMEMGVGEGLKNNAKPEGMAAELADAVIRIFDLAAWLNLDIATAIEWKMAYNKSRSHKHGGKNV